MKPRHLLALDTLRGVLRLYTVLLISLPLLLGAVFFSLFQREQVVREEMENLVASLTQEGNLVRSWVAENFNGAEFLARMDAVHRGDIPAMTAIFQRYAETHPSISDVLFATPDGVTVASAASPSSVFVGDREYFQAAREGRQSLASGLLRRTTGQPSCIFATPVAGPDGGFAGVIIIPVQLDVLDKWLRQATSGVIGGGILCDGEGRILAPSSAMTGEAARVPRQLLDAGESGSVYRGADGREMIGAAIDLDRAGWRLVREVAVAELLTGYRTQVVWLLLGAFATIVLAMPVALWFCGKLERPLRTLARYAAQMRDAGYEDRCTLGVPEYMPRELRELYEAFCDMACKVRLHMEEVGRLSVQDALTGLRNRRFLYADGARLLDAAIRAGQPCCALMVDVDFFKTVNDTHGHQAGDRVLAHVAGIIAASVRKSDLAVRYGGEEFVVLLTGADLTRGAELGERIRRTVAETPCDAGALSLRVTVSVGVAMARHEVAYGSGLVDDLLYRADQAMYAAKAAGRNRVVVENVD